MGAYVQNDGLFDGRACPGFSAALVPRSAEESSQHCRVNCADSALSACFGGLLVADVACQRSSALHECSAARARVRRGSVNAVDTLQAHRGELRCFVSSRDFAQIWCCIRLQYTYCTWDVSYSRTKGSQTDGTKPAPGEGRIRSQPCQPIFAQKIAPTSSHQHK